MHGAAIIITASELNNFFALRRREDADPEIQALANVMWRAMLVNNPTHPQPGEWHLSYVEYEDILQVRTHLKKGRITRDEPSSRDIRDVLLKMGSGSNGTENAFQLSLSVF